MRVLPLIMFLGVLLADAPEALEHLGKLDVEQLPEASGIVKSRRYPDVFWTHNDSGNGSTIFAIRRDGSVVQSFRLNVPNVDWEEISTDDAGRLYVGDTGNNHHLLGLRAVHQLDEPDPNIIRKEPLKVTATSYYAFRKPDRFDSEGFFIDPATRDAVLITKRLDGKEAELYHLPFHPPGALLRPASPRKLGKLAGFIEPVTGASLSRDGRRLAVCSSRVTRVYQRGADDNWELLAEVRYRDTSVEGIAWDEDDLLLVSEGRGIDRIRAERWKAADARTHAPRPARKAAKRGARSRE